MYSTPLPMPLPAYKPSDSSMNTLTVGVPTARWSTVEKRSSNSEKVVTVWTICATLATVVSKSTSGDGRIFLVMRRSGVPVELTSSATATPDPSARPNSEWMFSFSNAIPQQEPGPGANRADVTRQQEIRQQEAHRRTHVQDTPRGDPVSDDEAENQQPQRGKLTERLTVRQPRISLIEEGAANHGKETRQQETQFGALDSPDLLY